MVAVLAKEALLHVAVDDVAGRLDGHEAVKVVLDKDADSLAPRINRAFQVLNTETKVGKGRVGVLNLDEQLGVKALGTEQSCGAWRQLQRKPYELNARVLRSKSPALRLARVLTGSLQAESSPEAERVLLLHRPSRTGERAFRRVVDLLPLLRRQRRQAVRFEDCASDTVDPLSSHARRRRSSCSCRRDRRRADGREWAKAHVCTLLMTTAIEAWPGRCRVARGWRGLCRAWRWQWRMTQRLRRQQRPRSPERRAIFALHNSIPHPLPHPK